MGIIQAACAAALSVSIVSPAFARDQQREPGPVPRLQIGAGVGVAGVNRDPVGLGVDGRFAFRIGHRLTLGGLFGFYGMNDEEPREGDIVPNGIFTISNRIPNVAQVRTWNAFVQWTHPSGFFVRPGGGIGFHSYAYYIPDPNVAIPERYLPAEGREGGFIFTVAAGHEFRRTSRFGFAIEGFIVHSTGEDSSGHRTVAGVNLVPLWRW